ncbi:MAG: CoA transferase [Phenylobacterium sp.]|uniref:CaiB/BaiF CoA transferase family protein n=1 Tax=Phenylobacterium sp. TaxID=1871053 RepID=UPI0025F69895|nr:CoA transferase [Phenylobacterium sp.]MBI1197798.1 CoA transferase [Phenylobacterium sp.]
MEQETASEGAPLEGVKILDLTAVVSGPFATMWLADQGAEVIKVEPPHGGEQGRYVGAGYLGYSALFATCNRNKRSLAVDLRDPKGLAAVLRLARAADVVIENFRPGVADRLGLGYEALAAENPRLIYASITGFGPTGPYAGRRTYDSIIQAMSGIADAQAHGSHPPALTYTIICDKVAGLSAAQAISAALYARSRTGAGRRISVSMLESSLAFNWPDLMWNHAFTSEGAPKGLALTDTYRLWTTADGHVAVVFISGRAFDEWCRALEAPPEIAGETFATEAESRLRWRELWPFWESRIASYSTAEVVERFLANGVPCGPVLARARLHEDPQVVHCDAVREVPHPARGGLRVARPGARFSGWEPGLPTPAPEIGEHSRQALAEAGLDDAEIEALIAAGAVRVSEA